MTESIITARDISKRYRLGVKTAGAKTFVGQMLNIVSTPVQNFKRLTRLSSFEDADASVFWALKDVNFDVKRGDVLGIVGRNGAGKSTLLKILSRITTPTTGEIRIDGRVASLLEVGTGFHPELTGRENVYMNGTILGMRRREIDGKFDEIVDFSGVDKFIDTPVKFYSSGMKVRLGFAVAAHLESEILIIDEVLAVGDAEFQQKCLGKMNEVSKNVGRTVLFVSHNMGAVKSLCNAGLFLKDGAVVYLSDDIQDVVTRYYQTTVLSETPELVSERKDRKGNGDVKIQSFELINSLNDTQIELGKQLGFKLSYSALPESFSGKILISINNFNGECILFIDSSTIREFPISLNSKGVVSINLSPDFGLPVGKYFINIAFYVNGVMADYVQRVMVLDVVDGPFYVNGKVPTGKGLCYVKQEWSYYGG